MRVVVSGTHASGKSTLIGDFALSHREWAILPDPFEDISAAAERPSAGVFYEQLRIAAERLLEPPTALFIAERGPLDFLAYLQALDTLDRSALSPELFAQGLELTAEAMAAVDLLVLLPLTGHIPVEICADEDPELRDATNIALLELAADPDLTAAATVVEIAGTPVPAPPTIRGSDCRLHGLRPLRRAVLLSGGARAPGSPRPKRWMSHYEKTRPLRGRVV